MTYTIQTSVHSIEECKRAVEELHKKGYTKEQITLVTNNASQEAILENWDLRGADGAIFSSHSLLEKVNNLFNLKQYEYFQKKRPRLSPTAWILLRTASLPLKAAASSSLRRKQTNNSFLLDSSSSSVNHEK